MKKAVAWPVAWALFWSGHLVSKLLYFEPGVTAYPLYNWLMCRSSDVQDWAGLSGPWEKP